MSLTAEEVVNLFEKDVSARKRLAELLTAEPDVRLAIINLVLRDVATKQDINELRKEMNEERKEMRREIGGLRKEMNELKERIARLEASSSLLVKVSMAVNVPILIAIIGLLLNFC